MKSVVISLCITLLSGVLAVLFWSGQYGSFELLSFKLQTGGPAGVLAMKATSWDAPFVERVNQLWLVCSFLYVGVTLIVGVFSKSQWANIIITSLYVAMGALSIGVLGAL